MTTRKLVPDTFNPTKAEDGTETPAAYSGHFVLRGLDYLERARLLRKLRDVPDPLDYLVMLVEELPKHVEAVDVTRVDDGHKFTSWDDVLKETDLGPTVSWLAYKLQDRARVGSPL